MKRMIIRLTVILVLRPTLPVIIITSYRNIEMVSFVQG